MALWIPGPWGHMDGRPAKPFPESPHQAAIAEPAEKDEPKRARRRKPVAED